MKIRAALLLLIVFLVSMRGYAADAEYIRYFNRVEAELGSMLNCRLIYSGTMYIEAVIEDHFQYQGVLNQIKRQERIREKIRTGDLDDTEKQFYSRVTVDDIDRCIADLKRSMQGYEIPSIYTYSMDGRKQRLDIVRPTREEENQSYIFNGKEGFMLVAGLTNDAPPRISQSFTTRWKIPGGCGGYGINLLNFLRGDAYQIESFNLAKRNLKLSSPLYAPGGRYFSIQLLDANPCYWTSAESYSDTGKIDHRVVCKDFRPIQGYLIPHRVSLQSNNYKGVLADYLILDLTEARFNDIDLFPVGFFEKP